MRVFIYATEGIYQGLHGISNQCVVEIKDTKEADEIGQEMAENLVEEYGLEDEYYGDEDDDEYMFDPEFNWNIYKIRDDVTESIEELDNIAYREGYETFIEEYCEEEELY